MGKGKGKSTKRAEKSALKTAKKAAKRAARESNPAGPSAKSIKKRALKEKIKNTPRPTFQPISLDEPTPLIKPPQHAKWPALFKKSLGLHESHIKRLDRVMQNMKSETVGMSEKEREEWELSPRSNWRKICGMMDRAREILAQEREAAKGILPAQFLRDKKGLGVAGTSFEPLGPKLAERAAALGYDNMGEQNGAKIDDEGDSEMEDVSDLSSDSDDSDLSEDSSDLDSSSDSEGHESDSTSNGSGASVSREEEPTTKKKDEPVVEQNPYFVVDTEPMPVKGLEKPSLKESKKGKEEKASQETVQPEPEVKSDEPVQNGKETKSKKRSSDENGEVKKNKKSKLAITSSELEPTAQPDPEPAPTTEQPKKTKKRSHTDADTESRKTKKHKAATTVVEVTKPESTVDFTEVQRKLQAEVDAGVAAKEAEKAAEKAKKKRRRSSGADVPVIKKVRKGKVFADNEARRS